jgi:dipeptidyl aminopeptidase/acylaminoacyl peptidase
MLAERLMLLGKNFDFAFAPAAGHGWAQREHYAVFLMKKLVEHFDRHLGRGPR